MSNVISFVVSILTIVGLWKMFDKAGEPGWAAIVPFYNAYVIFKISTGNGWKFLFMFIPLFNIVYYFIATNKLAKAYGKGTGFGIGLALLPAIFYIILGFDSSTEYVGVAE